MVATTTVEGGCDNNPGPYIELYGELTLGGLNGQLIFQNSERGTHKREEDVVVERTILEEGESIGFYKQPPLGGVGGNPKIYWQWTDSYGNPLSKKYYLGRCVQLGKSIHEGHGRAGLWGIGPLFMCTVPAV